MNREALGVRREESNPFRLTPYASPLTKERS